MGTRAAHVTAFRSVTARQKELAIVRALLFNGYFQRWLVEMTLGEGGRLRRRGARRLWTSPSRLVHSGTLAALEQRARNQRVSRVAQVLPYAVACAGR